VVKAAEETSAKGTPVKAGETPAKAGETPVSAGETPVKAGETPVKEGETPATAKVRPVTVKFRKGWDDENINAVEFAKMAEQAGAAAVAVHGRTRMQFYSGKADWDIIAKVKAAVKIPVIGNGDVYSGETAKEMFDETGADGIMIGRAAHGNPWIFKEVLSYLETGENPQKPNANERISMIIRHMDMLIKLKGETTGIREMRTHIAKYIKGFYDAKRIRDNIFRQKSRDAVVNCLNELRS